MFPSILFALSMTVAFYADAQVPPSALRPDPNAGTLTAKQEIRANAPQREAPLPALGSRAIDTAPARPALGIHAVNGSTHDVHLAAGDKVVITGVGFGNAATAAQLVGGTLGGHPLALRIERWTSTRIDAVVPPQPRASSTKAALEVRTDGGLTFRFDDIVLI